MKHKNIAKTVMLGMALTAFLSGKAYAKDGDIYNSKQENVGGIKNIVLGNREILFDMVQNFDKYGYEVSGKIYKAEEVNDLFNSNPLEGATKIHSKVLANLTAIKTVGGIEGEGTIVIKYISALNGSIIQASSIMKGSIGDSCIIQIGEIHGYVATSVKGIIIPFTKEVQTVEIKYDKAAEPKPGEDRFNTLLFGMKNYTKLYKVDSKTFQLDIEKSITNGEDSLVFNSSILTKLTLNGIKPSEVVIVKSKLPELISYRINMPSEVIGESIAVKFLDVSLDTFPLNIGNADMLLNPIVFVEEPVKEILTKELTDGFNGCLSSLSYTATVTKISDKKIKLDLLKNVSYSGYELIYDDKLLASTYFYGKLPVSVFKLADTRVDYNSYEIELASVIEQNRIPVDFMNLHLRNHPTLNFGSSVGFDVK